MARHELFNQIYGLPELAQNIIWDKYMQMTKKYMQEFVLVHIDVVSYLRKYNPSTHNIGCTIYYYQIHTESNFGTQIHAIPKFILYYNTGKLINNYSLPRTIPSIYMLIIRRFMAMYKNILLNDNNNKYEIYKCYINLESILCSDEPYLVNMRTDLLLSFKQHWDAGR